MFQRLIHNSFELKMYSKSTYFLLGLPSKFNKCYQCRFRLYSQHRMQPALPSYYERLFSSRPRLFNIRLRHYSSQIDTHKKNDDVENLKEKETLDTSKKINVKLKPTEVKRLFGLAEPEKWTLTGEFLDRLILAFKYL